MGLCGKCGASGLTRGEAADGHFPQHHGFCLECQHLPDSPNQDYPPEYSAILQPGEVYQQTTIHRFSWGQ